MTTGSAIYIILDRGKANGLMQRAREIGVRQGTIFLGEGTMSSPILEFFGINRTQKEVVLVAAPEQTAQQLYQMLREQFHMHRRYHGIAFSVPYRRYDPQAAEEGELPGRDLNAPYVCIMTVLERGLGAECMKLARAAGARGGTIVHAHGAGVPQGVVFPLNIEPQKDILMIVTRRGQAPAIRRAIYEGMRLERRGAGIIFALPVTRTLGLYEERQQEKAVKP
jgi:hypothetical protein